MAIALSYADVENVLAGLHRIADDKRVAFRARLKHLQRLGFPEGVNTGTGKRVSYTLSMLFQLALAMELTQVGLAPKRIVKIINLNWEECQGSLAVAITPESQFEKWTPPITSNQFVWMLSPEALRDLSDAGEEDEDYRGYLRVVELQDLPQAMKLFAIDDDDVGEDYRQVVIVLQPFILNVSGRLFEVRPDLILANIAVGLFEMLTPTAQRKLGHRLVMEDHNGIDPQT